MPVPGEEEPPEAEDVENGDAAAREEQERKAAEQKVADDVDQYGFGVLWDVCSHLMLFLSSPSLSSASKLDYTSPFVICQQCFGVFLGCAYVKYGTVGMVLGKRVETVSWALLWFLGFFLCLATDAESIAFMNTRFPGESAPLASFPFVVFPGQIIQWFLIYGPVSLWLFPARHIFWYLKKGGDRVYFYSKLFVLLASDFLLYVFCKYRDAKFNDVNKTFAEEFSGPSEGAFAVKLTLEESREVAYTMFAGVKWTVILDVLLVYVLPAAIGAAAMIFVHGIRFYQRNRVHAQRMFLGFPGVHLE